MAAAPLRRAPVLFRRLVLGSLTALCLLQAAASPRWRIEHDTPMLHYAAFLMDERGRFPYCDLFETSMPGAFAFHYAVVKLFGYGDTAFRLVDLALLAALLGAVSLWRTLRPGYAAVPPKGGRVDEMAELLRARLGPGDTVQPLDRANGAVHSTLLARATLATKFFYDYHFYHHTASPVVAGLRREFLEELRRAAPRFILEVTADKPWFPAPGSPAGFPELYRHVGEHYAVAARGRDYVLYEREEGGGAPGGASAGGGRDD